MKASQRVVQQIERSLRKVVSRFPSEDEPVLTDIHIEVRPDSGEIRTYDDDDRELDRCVVDEWINMEDPEDFYNQVAPVLRQCIQSLRKVIDRMSLMRPYSFVLVDENHETLQELVVIDDEDTILLDGELLQGLDEDLDTFLKKLMQE